MHMKIAGNARWIMVAVVIAALTVLVTSASAREVQLAGIRLDAPWVTVLDVFGSPDGVVTYGGGGAAAGGGGGMGGGMMGADMGGGMGGGMMGGMGMGMGMGAPAGMGAGAPAGMGGGMMGGGGGMGMGGPAAGGGGGGSVPVWAMPIWVVLEEGEVEWFYRKGDVCLGFVFNRDGYVRVIAVAGEDCDYARTALWRPHRYVKLGDDFKRVLYRYGYPDEVEPFTGDVGGGGGGGGGAAPGGAGGGMGMGGGAEGGMGMGMMGGGGGMTGAGIPGGGGVGVRTAEGGAGGGGMGGPGAMGGAPAAGGGGGGGGGAAATSGSVSVTFNGQTNTFSRDAVLTYSDNNNIAFTLHNMKVTRIHIWK
jgi:hypothetical protein